MNFTYPKKQKLKSQKTINSLFSQGKSVSKYPLRIVYNIIENDPEISCFENSKIGVSVSKKYFKKAVDRNYFKRLLRESYRLNQHLISENLDKSCAMMIFYQTKDRLSFQEINERTVILFEKFVQQVNKEDFTNTSE